MSCTNLLLIVYLKLLSVSFISLFEEWFGCHQAILTCYSTLNASLFPLVAKHLIGQNSFSAKYSLLHF